MNNIIIMNNIIRFNKRTKKKHLQNLHSIFQYACNCTTGRDVITVYSDSLSLLIPHLLFLAFNYYCINNVKHYNIMSKCQV